MNNYLKGRLAQQTGEFFENIIKAKCKEYHDNNIAHIQKLPVEKKLCRGKLIYAERSTVDFLGFTY